MTRDEAAPYLRRLFASGDDGLSPPAFAEAFSIPIQLAMSHLEVLYRQRLVSRVPNQRGAGYVCRIPKKGDLQNGFLFDVQGETMVKLKKAKKAKALAKPVVDQISLF